MDGVAAAEQEFEQRLKAFERDASTCAVFGYSEFTLHFIAGYDFAVIDRLNSHPAFWNALLGGLQASAIVALGRIFDRKPNTYSGAELLDFADTYLGIFARPALEARKTRDGLSPTDAKAYAAEAFELRPGGLSDLRRQFDAKQQFFQDKVAPIRHNVYAHAGQLTIAERDALFNGLPVRSLEDLIVFPLRLERCMSQLYHNGRQPVIEDTPSMIADVLKATPAPGVTSWEHLHAAGNAAAFLDWLRGTPLDDD